ncbi:hypothetical protein [Methylacidimicrobium sp. B4]|uniref:hypothetical protein n=1 Tax=Methylacidimicrobium sp. B4 TaxID=2796139 RepID=UPI001A8C71B7|nr:hypothetical protein [Methylacidimicrobium sp. B4]QSR84783.1 hypothetical protein MacB4_00375 [Methylacidimicrobium sp. B4]
MKPGGRLVLETAAPLFFSAASLPLPRRPEGRRAEGWPRQRLALLFLALAILCAAPSLCAQRVQLLSVRKYYTLFLSSGQNGGREPLLREIFLYRFRNFGSTAVLPTYHDELPQQPYLEYRDRIDGRSVPVSRIGNRYWEYPTFRGGRTIELRTDALQRVLPRDPRQKIDFFEDSIQWGGWRPPIDDYWIIVDLGKMYASFRQTPAFGMGGAPPPTFPEFLTNQVTRVLPAGYRIQGSTVWWHFQRIYALQGSTTLHVEWKAWYR